MEVKLETAMKAYKHVTGFIVTAHDWDYLEFKVAVECVPMVSMINHPHMTKILISWLQQERTKAPTREASPIHH